MLFMNMIMIIITTITRRVSTTMTGRIIVSSPCLTDSIIRQVREVPNRSHRPPSHPCSTQIPESRASRDIPAEKTREMELPRYVAVMEAEGVRPVASVTTQ
jgi:hypothetical protein